jgi:preprotein translocase subunit SecG
MINVLLIVHIIVATALIGVVLVQKNEGGGLGIGGGGGGGGMSGLMTGRGAANLLTRVTKYLAGLFMALSLALTIMMNQRQDSGSLVDQLRDSGTPGITGEGTTGESGTPAPAPATTEPAPKVE